MKALEAPVIANRIGFVAAAMLFAAGTAEAQRPRSDRDAVVLDGRIPVITDARGRAARVEDPRLYFARERDKCQRHAARANWWRVRAVRGDRNAQRHELHEMRKAQRCFDRLLLRNEGKRARRAGRVAVMRPRTDRPAVVRRTDGAVVVRRGSDRGATVRRTGQISVVRR